MFEEEMNEHGAAGAGSGGHSVFSGFESCGSSSSDLNTPAVSEMDSMESDEDDFMAELTRQMAENMLQEDDDKATTPNSSVSEKTEKLLGRGGSRNFCTETPISVLPDPITQIHSNQVGFADQYYHHPKKVHHHQPQNKEYSHSHGRRAGFLSALQSGSGMRVVFLGGSGSRSASSGTGVFLPNATNNPPQYQTRKKPVCSTVLIPERVLQTLKQHFEKGDAVTRSNGGLHARRNQRWPPHKLPENNQELQLPQEWTY